jgi:hypothetical protein
MSVVLAADEKVWETFMSDEQSDTIKGVAIYCSADMS